jgi:hypothetical protein
MYDSSLEIGWEEITKGSHERINIAHDLGWPDHDRTMPL